MNYSGLIVVALGCLLCVFAEVTVLNKPVQVIYDSSPRLRIRGSGFGDVDVNDATGLRLGAVHAPQLVMNKDYLIILDEDGDEATLKLLPNRK